MEGLATDVLRKIAGQEGAGWLLFVVACVAAFWLLLKLLKTQDECEAARDVLHEKRITEARETIAALNSAAQANADLAKSIEARTRSIETLIQLITQMERDAKNSFDHWNRRVSGLEENLKEINGRLENLQRRNA